MIYSIKFLCNYNHYYFDYPFSIALVILFSIVIVTLAVMSYSFYKDGKLNKAIYFSFSILLVIFIYILIQGHTFISDELYPHIISELGFLIVTLGAIDYFKNLFKAREDELKKEIDIEDEENEEADFRKVIAALLNPSYTFRTLKGILKETELEEKRVTTILNHLIKIKRAQKRKNKNGVDVWRIISS